VSLATVLKLENKGRSRSIAIMQTREGGLE